MVGKKADVVVGGGGPVVIALDRSCAESLYVALQAGLGYEPGPRRNGPDENGPDETSPRPPDLPGSDEPEK